MSHIQIDGPAGSLEGVFEAAGSSRFAVLCHPHPLYGGSMHDMVLNALCAAMQAVGVGTLRFNFRGVGASQGVHDEGQGEVEDVLAVVDWLRREANPETLVLGGYSFGAAMALRAADQSECDRLVLVAPPVAMIPGLSQPGVATQVILGAVDQIVDADKSSQWFGDTATTHIIAGADHFFLGAHDEITSLVAQFLQQE